MTGFDVPVGIAPVCLVCGDDRAVRMGLMRYRDADENGQVFASGWRCIDHRACRDRYEAATGERYPLEDAR